MEENPGFVLVVTGHSLGGAAAVFAAAILRKQYKDVTLYKFGQPRAGNKNLTEAVTAQGKNYCVTHTSDIVPKLPPEQLRSGGGDLYLHISPEYWISDGL
jgi:predicted lipase